MPAFGDTHVFLFTIGEGKLREWIRRGEGDDGDGETEDGRE
jgi:hypothetical protein